MRRDREGGRRARVGSGRGDERARLSSSRLGSPELAEARETGDVGSGPSEHRGVGERGAAPGEERPPSRIALSRASCTSARLGEPTQDRRTSPGASPDPPLRRARRVLEIQTVAGAGAGRASATGVGGPQKANEGRSPKCRFQGGTARARQRDRARARPCRPRDPPCRHEGESHPARLLRWRKAPIVARLLPSGPPESSCRIRFPSSFRPLSSSF